MIIGERLRKLREERGYSREKLAYELEIGVAQVSRYERGENDATGDVLSKFARFFGVTTDYLLGLSTDPFSGGSDLKPEEAAALNAWRQGDKFGAIKVIVDDE